MIKLRMAMVGYDLVNFRWNNASDSTAKWKGRENIPDPTFSLIRYSSAPHGNMNSIGLYEPNARSQKRSLRVRYSRFYILQ